MMLSLSILATALASANGFSTSPIASNAVFSRSSVVLSASKNKAKTISRTKWAEARGYGSTASSEETVTAASSGLMTNDEGLEYVRLVNAIGDTSDVYLYGGVVTSYVVGGQEYIAVRPDAKMDGSKPISGGLSHCWPQFGPGEIQQHGFARNVNWTVKSMTETTVELEMAPSDYTKAMWDKEFLCTFSVALEDDKLSTKMFVENKGEESFDFQAALHSYFTVSAMNNLSIAGSFKGKEFLNKMVGGGEMQTEDRDEITISEEYDRVYMGVNDPVLKDSGIGKTVSVLSSCCDYFLPSSLNLDLISCSFSTQLTVLNTAGYEDTVLWNPYGNEGMGYNNFVCVESVKVSLQK
jgi:glucose-6-phosphate 1-epimerase